MPDRIRYDAPPWITDRPSVSTVNSWPLMSQAIAPRIVMRRICWQGQVAEGVGNLAVVDEAGDDDHEDDEQDADDEARPEEGRAAARRRGRRGGILSLGAARTRQAPSMRPTRLPTSRIALMADLLRHRVAARDGGDGAPRPSPAAPAATTRTGLVDTPEVRRLRSKPRSSAVSPVVEGPGSNAWPRKHPRRVHRRLKLVRRAQRRSGRSRPARSSRRSSATVPRESPWPSTSRRRPRRAGNCSSTVHPSSPGCSPTSKPPAPTSTSSSSGSRRARSATASATSSSRR